MAESTKPHTTKPAADTAPAAASTGGDRVAMLSLRADGTPDQTSPQLIGDRAAALAATREQLVQQAVSDADHSLRTAAPPAAAPPAVQDPAIAELADAHQAAAAAAETAAAALVDDLHPAPAPSPAGSDSK